MNKKIKIVSTVALAGVLSLNVFNTKTLAANIDVALKGQTQVIGTTTKLINGENIVPVVLEGATDTLTLSELKAKYPMATGFKVKNENAIATGDYFTLNGKKHTVVVYGDVNSDGKANSTDAMDVLKYSVNQHTYEFNKYQSLAADVNGIDGKKDSNDAMRILKYSVGQDYTTLVDKVPETDKEDESEENLICTLTISEDNVINNTETGSDIQIIIEPTERLSENLTGLQLKLTGVNKTTPENAETVTLPGITLDKNEIVNNSQKLTSAQNQIGNFADGTLKLELLDGTTVIGKTDVVLNTLAPVATNVKTSRNEATRKATISLEKGNESDITKVYYVLEAYSASATSKTVNDIVTNGKVISDIKDSKVSNATIDQILDKGAYKVCYVLENSYGSRSEAVGEVAINTDGNLTSQDKVTITAPNLAGGVTKFTWEDENTSTSGKYVVSLCRGDEILETTSITAKEFNLGSTKYINEEGKYTVKVYIEGTDTLVASDVETSPVAEIKQLPMVTDLKFSDGDNGEKYLSWTNPNSVNDFKEYTVNLVEINEDGTDGTSTSVAVAKDKNKTEDLKASLSPNKLYKAEVTVVKNDGQSEYLTSEIATSENETYKVSNVTAASNETTENSVKLQITNPINVNGKESKYSVEVYPVNEEHFTNSDIPEHDISKMKLVKNLELNDSNQLVVENLESNTLYDFKVVVSIDGNEVKTGYTGAVRTLPVIEDLTVVNSVDDTKTAKTVYVDGTNKKIAINGKERSLATDYNNSTILDNEIKIIAQLSKEDKVSINGGDVALVLNSRESTIDFSTGVSIENLTISTNDFLKTIKGTVETLTLSKGEFNIDAVTAQNVVVENKTYVTANKALNYTISANVDDVEINKVQIESTLETKMNIDPDPESESEPALDLAIKVTANTAENTLKFTNRADQNVEISFVGTVEDAQSGKIIINSNDGKVTVTSTLVNVKAKLDVTIENGDVEVVAPALTGEKNITVKKDATSNLSVIAKENAPFSFSDTSVDLSDNDLKTALANANADISAASDVTDDMLNTARKYLNSFGLSETGATITVTKDTNAVTIVLTNLEKDVTIENIK